MLRKLGISTTGKYMVILTLAGSLTNINSQANVCPEGGRYQFYPSFVNSSSFFECLNSALGTENTGNYTCPQGQVFKPRNSFDDSSPLCVSSNSEYGDAAFLCNGSNGFGSYTGDQSLYVSCQNGTIFECPKGEFFIDSIQSCNVTCEVRYKIGSFALSNNEYYTCAFDYGTLRWILTRSSCPTETTFNELLQFCLPPVIIP